MKRLINKIKKKKIINMNKFIIHSCILLVVLIIFLLGIWNVLDYQREQKELRKQQEIQKQQQITLQFIRQNALEMARLKVNGEVEIVLNKYNFEKQTFIVTAYDLSYQSTGKRISSRSYGITYSGFNLRGKDYESARVIAVDKNVIPINSKVYIKFDDKKYEKYNSIYTASDIGGAIKGNRIDLFVEDSGEKVSTKAMDFGVTTAKIIIIK